MFYLLKLGKTFYKNTQWLSLPPSGNQVIGSVGGAAGASGQSYHFSYRYQQWPLAIQWPKPLFRQPMPTSSRRSHRLGYQFQRSGHQTFSTNGCATNFGVLLKTTLYITLNTQKYFTKNVLHVKYFIVEKYFTSKQMQSDWNNSFLNKGYNFIICASNNQYLCKAAGASGYK